MKYIVITSKHHDGFALFDSQVSDYNIVDATPFKRDMIAELKAACDAEGIKLGLYYSHAQDWYHRGGSHHHNWKTPSGMDEMKDYLNNISLPQVKEILTQYQPAIIWYDTPRRMTPAMAEPFSKLVREISPGTLINSRIALDGNKMDKVSQKDLDMLKSLDTDYLSYADREIPANSPWDKWETCMTLNSSWGFTHGDNAWKSPSRVIMQLLEVVSKNGAFLLNVGPTAEGELPAESITVLKQVGDWLKLNGDAVYGAQPVSFNLPGTPTAESLKQTKKPASPSSSATPPTPPSIGPSPGSPPTKATPSTSPSSTGPQTSSSPSPRSPKTSKTSKASTLPPSQTNHSNTPSAMAPSPSAYPQNPPAIYRPCCACG